MYDCMHPVSVSEETNILYLINDMMLNICMKSYHTIDIIIFLYHVRHGTWLDATDSETEGVWVWGNGSLVTWTNWKSGNDLFTSFDSMEVRY